MNKEKIKIGNIPALLYGTNSDNLYIFVHGRYGKKEDADGFAAIAAKIGYQVISFDLPEHGERKDEEYGCIVTEKSILDFFVKKYNCNLEVHKNGGHYFHTAEQLGYLENWMERVIEL